tara:strand:- start:14674 stop:15312 length:639 start_codon:yes stop_codon:yes gene_type:complete
MKRTVESTKLKINEIFYSLQGEGARAGEPSIFIRLQGCSAKNACFKSGVHCDTEFESGYEMSVEELKDYLLYNYSTDCEWIVWTGGEPSDQLTDEIVAYFKPYKQAIETSGIKSPPTNLDWVVVSPKVAEHVILKKLPIRRNQGIHCDELRWVRKTGQAIPETKILANRYFISPHFNGEEIDMESLNHCIQLCLDNPKWTLSVQQHKLWKVR